jgi:uncharacterized membrane protein YhaH (DUF805 family)
MTLFERLWRLEGTVGRGAYAIGGTVGFALKYAIDWSVAHFALHQPWTPLSYWRFVDVRRPMNWPLFLTLFIIAIPFLWFGMTMTLLRLRDAGRSAGWAALFFVPVANVVMFATLCTLPARRGARDDLSRVLESALFAVIATVALATTAIALSTNALSTYGFGLFVAVPFTVGYLAAFIYAVRNPASHAQPYAVAGIALALLGGLLLALSWEGVICLLMAAPLAVLVAFFGAWCGVRSAHSLTPANRAPAAMVIVLPLLILGEASLHRDAPLYRVDSAIIINAPPAEVWKHVVSFSDITEKPEWLFRAGIAYPLRARIDGRGAGAIRRCEFTTGTFVEPIEVWDEPRLLRFGVTANPPPMRELSPFGAVDAPHLHGFLLSEQGEFLLEPISGGRTRLVGSTWYRHHLWPAAYWRAWSDAIIHRIHLRVLRHVAALSEQRIG